MLLFLAGLVGSFLSAVLLERWVDPQPEVRKPLIHRLSMLTALPGMLFYFTMFMISYRPIFSFAVTTLVYLAIVILNNAKYAALKEPLVFSDFALLNQAVKHPALYVKYIGVLNIVMVTLAGALVIASGIIYEPPLLPRDSVAAFFPTGIYLFVVLGMINAVTRGPLRKPFRDLLMRFGPTTDIRRDLDQLSLVVCIIVYFFLANEPERPEERTNRPAGSSTPKNTTLAWAHPGFRDLPLPPVVAVQAESFFDVRRLSTTAIDPQVLANFQDVTSSASYCGRLAVPAWGANTMRTEFAFLSGLPNEALGVHRFNPYLQLCKKPVWTIATQLRAMGYRTVCIHPFESSFFDRNDVYPNLGFDDFLDIRSFPEAERFGPYVSDRAVGEKVKEVLAASTQPTFIFAITMENHGKWEVDRLDGHADQGDIADPPFGSPELALYIRHVRNTDQMIGQIVDDLRRRDGDGVFCLFGDHVPSLPKLFQRIGHTDPRTDYFVWKKSGRQPRELNIGADALGRLVLDTVLNQANHAPVQRIRQETA